MAGPHHSPGQLFSWLRKLIGWLRDIGAAPGNLKRLASAQQAEADGRLKCLSCATGRVGTLQAHSARFGEPDTKQLGAPLED
jgi:hypothetical protein